MPGTILETFQQASHQKHKHTPETFPKGFFRWLQTGMCSRTKLFTVSRRQLGMHTVVLDSCVFVWVGERRRIDALGFAHAARGATLLESASGLPIDTLTRGIGRLFPQKQVFFSTDLSTDDVDFWADIFKCIAEEVRSNPNFYGALVNAST